jgi:hypothetical protein
MQRKIKKANSSGIVRIQGDILFWDDDNKNIHQINLNDVVVIGEYTHPGGPYIDDWFLTFVTKDGQWQSIPWCADNIIELTQYLTNKFDQDLNTTYLADSTEWKSIIRYPTYLKEKILFTLTNSATYKKPKTFLDKILSSIGFCNFDTSQNINLTEEVKNALKHTNL